jgi:hypothetical protein
MPTTYGAATTANRTGKSAVVQKSRLSQRLFLRIKKLVRPCYLQETPEQKAYQRRKAVDRRLSMMELDLVSGQGSGI